MKKTDPLLLQKIVKKLKCRLLEFLFGAIRVIKIFGVAFLIRLLI